MQKVLLQILLNTIAKVIFTIAKLNGSRKKAHHWNYVSVLAFGFPCLRVSVMSSARVYIYSQNKATKLTLFFNEIPTK